MELAGLLGFLAFTATGFVVGFRLLGIGWRTGQLPELTIGASLVLAGGLGGLLGVIAARLELLLDSPVQPVFAVSNLAVQAGVAFLAVFTRQVFRPREAWARVLFWICSACLAASFLGRIVLGDFRADTASPLAWFELGTRIAVYAWALTETLREYAAVRRRCAIGLAHPLVANRFLLWAVALSSTLAIWLYAAAMRASGRSAEGSWLLVAVFGFACAAALWLAFFPPEAYRRRFAPPAGAR